ncbi:MAG: transporter [Vampirovibrio sp.]|jgi:MFS family permease|nr:transporter [Vampirovibrio sp.]
MPEEAALKANKAFAGLKHLFRALSSRNFRLFISGQVISLLGTWMQQMAMSWMVYRLTHSAFMLGLVAFLSQAPGFFIAPMAGVMADRVNRHKLLIITQTLAMAQAFALAYLSLSGRIEVWHVLYLSVFMGVITGIDTPVRQSFVVDMLDKPENLSNAISLNSSVFNGTRLIGPAIAGIMIATVGEGWCFFLNGTSYIAVILALLSMRLTPKPVVQHTRSYLESVREGFSYAYHFPAMRAILLLVALVSLAGLPYSVLVPVYARDILHGDAQTLGYLMGSVGAGALTGAFYLASRSNVLGLGRLIPIAAGLFGITLVGFAFSHTLWLSMGLIYLLGLCMMMQLASSNILLQTLADEPMRGRIMSLYTMAFLGMTPFGSLMIGSMATHIGVSTTLAIGGCTCIAGAVLFSSRLSPLRKTVLPTYAQRGILQETLPQQEVAKIR